LHTELNKEVKETVFIWDIITFRSLCGALASIKGQLYFLDTNEDAI